ncbi:MAG TPA: hypothetical protein VGF77_00885 [Allosphingosinicella sp.]
MPNEREALPEPVRGLVSRAYEARRRGEAGAALALYREAAAASADDPAGRAHCLRHVGDLEREAGRPAEARAALAEAEALYRRTAGDILSLANTVRLVALVDGSPERWREARALYEQAGEESGLDLGPAFAECDRHLSA